MLLRPLHHLGGHLRHNVIAYLALFLAAGGGAGYAIAAANSNTIHGCVDNRTRALYIQKRCHSGQSRLVWNQGPQGPQAQSVTAWASVNAAGLIGGARGISVQHVSTGTYNVTATPPQCAHIGAAPTVTVDAGPPAGGPLLSPGAFPVAWETFSENNFIVYTGVVSGGSFTLGDEAFNVQVPCS
jgi:hypothetical protein